MKITNKYSLLLCCALQLLTSSALLAEFDLDDFKPAQHRAHYNSLPSVEKSNEDLQKSTQFQTFIKEADEVVTRYGFNDLVGVGLIHRHFDLAENQVMVEKYKVVNTIPSLVTKARSLDEAKEMGAVPSSWIFSSTPNKEVYLFETSTDQAVVKARATLEKSPEFFQEMGQLIRQHNMSHLLSLSVLKRDSLVSHEGQDYIEINNTGPKSVVQLNSAPEILEKSIRTTWSFKGPINKACIIGCKRCFICPK